MRKRTQKLSALLLSLAMVLSALPFNLVYADDGAANSENPANAAAENPQKDADGQNAAAGNEKTDSENKSDAEKKTTQESPKASQPKAQADEDADADNADKKDADSKDAADSKDEKVVTIKSVQVAYADGKAVEDGHKLDIFRSDVSDEGKTYTIKDGKISDVKLVAGVPYKIAISWDDPDPNFAWDYEMAYAQDLYVRVIVSENSKCMMGYDNDAKEPTGKAVTKLVIKEMDAEDPAEQTVTIPSVKVRYANRKPVEDGHIINFARSDESTSGEDYTVKNGKITNVKMIAGLMYKVGISYEDEDFSWDYEMCYAQDGYVRVIGLDDSKTLMGYDNEAKEVTGDPVRELVIKEYGEADPVPQDKEVTVADIPVVYEDGTPVSDDENMELDLINMKSLLDDVQHYYVRYKVKDGKISGVKMNSETQYKIGFDTKNPFWQTHDVVGAYNSKKLMRIFARYDGKLPLQYDYDEGIDGDEKTVDKIVVKKIEGTQDPCVRPASCWMSLPLSDNGYYAESGYSWKLTRLDTGKSKTVYNREGDLTLVGEEKVPYLLTLDENETYELDFDTNPLFKQYKDRGGIPFHWEADSEGKTQAVLDGYDVEDIEGRLNYNYVDLKRIDGKTNSTGHKFSDDDCGDDTEVKTLYSKDIVTLKGIKVNEVTDQALSPISKDVTFVFYDSSTQTVEKKVKSINGVLPDVEMYKDHHYIVYAEDSEYEMPNYYIELTGDGEAPITYKGTLRNVTSFDMTKRTTPLAKPEDAARVHIKMPVYYVDQDGDMNTVANVKVRLVNQYDTVETTSDADGNIEADLMEDYNYMVLIDSERYSIESFPLTVKDKSEYGAGKYTYNHFSCGAVGALYLVDKGTEHDRDVTMVGSSNNTSVTGLNFGTGSYYINDRVVDQKVDALDGKDYEVVDIDAINMYRVEISKLSAGDFVITRTIPEGKEVEAVYYSDDKGDLHKLDFTTSNGLVTFKMGSISLYNNVIVYKSDEPSKPTEPSDKPTVNAAPKVTLSSTSYTYNGKAKKPSVTVKVNGKKLSFKEYTVSYSAGRKKVGTYTVKVTLKSNKKTATATFRINPKNTKMKSLKKGKKAFTIKWLRKGPQVTGYQVQYSTSKKFTGKSTKIKTIKGYKHNHKKITKLAKKKKYYARVRTYKVVKGTKYYSKWSKAKSVKTK